jgi:hypothetical protein
MYRLNGEDGICHLLKICTTSSNNHHKKNTHRMGGFEKFTSPKLQMHPEGRSSERRTIQPSDSKSVTCLSTQCYGVLQRPSSLESRGIFVQAVHGVHAVSQILHRNCTGFILGKATRIPLFDYLPYLKPATVTSLSIADTCS